MDIHRIALYLAGKLPPYYQAPFDKLELIELIRGNSKKGYTADFFKLVDSEDFYAMCLNRVQKADSENFLKIIKKLEVPEDAGGLEKKLLHEDKLAELKKEFEELNDLNVTGKDKQKRGYKFERWLKDFFDLFGLEPRAAYKTQLDQIDGSFVLDGKEYLLEAKWTIKPSDTNVDDKMFGRLNRCLIGTIGLIISKAGFTENAKKAAAIHKNILLMSGKDILEVLNGKIDLESQIRKIRRRMAEEGEAFLI